MNTRILIVSDIDPLTNRLGSTEYLDSVAGMLASGGEDPDLVVTGLHGPGVVRIPIGSADHYARHYRSVRIYRTIRIGGHFYSTDPRQWLDRVRKRLGFGMARKGGWLAMPDAARLRWAARHASRLGAETVIANYFNAAAIHPLLPPGTTRAVIMHDYLAARLDSFRRSGNTPDFDPALVERELDGLKGADLCLAIKEEDRVLLAQRLPQLATLVVPVTVTQNTDASAVPLAPVAAPVAVMVGGGFVANIQGLDWLLREVWPQVRTALPQARLRVIGKMAQASGLAWPEGAEKVGFVEDLEQEYRQATLSLAPLFIGSGVKIKVVEALGHGVPVVATACGAEGLGAVGTQDMDVTDTPEDFAAHVIARLSSSESTAVRAARCERTSARFDRVQVGARLRAALLDAGTTPPPPVSQT